MRNWRDITDVFEMPAPAEVTGFTDLISLERSSPWRDHLVDFLLVVGFGFVIGINLMAHVRQQQPFENAKAGLVGPLKPPSSR
ncbi:MAG TPA: hypothetical protein VM598_03265 [Bdellovibrionota bacterium]|nr:hypothetical protein [Bdellovibrionota bacterium]